MISALFFVGYVTFSNTIATANAGENTQDSAQQESVEQENYQKQASPYVLAGLVGALTSGVVSSTIYLSSAYLYVVDEQIWPIFVGPLASIIIAGLISAAAPILLSNFVSIDWSWLNGCAWSGCYLATASVAAIGSFFLVGQLLVDTAKRSETEDWKPVLAVVLVPYVLLGVLVTNSIGSVAGVTASALIFDKTEDTNMKKE